MRDTGRNFGFSAPTHIRAAGLTWGRIVAAVLGFALVYTVCIALIYLSGAPT